MANFKCRALWWALVVSLLVYVDVAHVTELPPNPNAPVSLLLLVFGALSAAIAVGTVVYRRRALSEPIQSGRLDPTTPEGFQIAFTPYVLNLVLSESVGIYGLVLSLLSGNTRHSIAFSAAAVALLVVHRPTAPDLVPPLSARRPRSLPPHDA